MYLALIASLDLGDIQGQRCTGVTRHFCPAVGLNTTLRLSVPPTSVGFMIFAPLTSKSVSELNKMSVERGCKELPGISPP